MSCRLILYVSVWWSSFMVTRGTHMCVHTSGRSGFVFLLFSWCDGLSCSCGSCVVSGSGVGSGAVVDLTAFTDFGLDHITGATFNSSSGQLYVVTFDGYILQDIVDHDCMLTWVHRPIVLLW